MVKYSYFLIVFTILALGCNDRERENTPTTPLALVVIEAVDLQIETPISLNCDGLKDYFQDQVSIDTLRDLQSLRVLDSAVSAIRSLPSEFQPDVRAVLRGTYSDGRRFTVCMSDIAMTLDGTPVQFSDRIRDIVMRDLAKK